MRWHYDLMGGQEIVRDVLCYDAAAIVAGELLMLGVTDPDSNADHNVAFVTAYTGANTEAVDALGICKEGGAPTALPDVAVDANYLKAIVNPGAVYLAEYSQVAADDIALTQAVSTTALTLTSLEDDIDTGYLFSTSLSATSGFAGQLMYLSACASGSATLETAPTTAGATADTLIKILPVNHRLVGLNAGATALISAAAASSTVSLQIVENWIYSKKSYPLTQLRRADHAGIVDMADARFYADIVMLDHVYNNA